LASGRPVVNGNGRVVRFLTNSQSYVTVAGTLDPADA